MLISFKVSLRFRTQFLCCSSVLLIAGVLRVQLDPKEPCRVCWMSLELSRSSWAERLERMHLTPRCPRWPVSSTFNKRMQNLGYKDNQLPVGEGRFCDFPYLNNFPTNGLEKITCLRNESSQEDCAAFVKRTLETKDEGRDGQKQNPKWWKCADRESVKGKTVETNVSLWKQNAANYKETLRRTLSICSRNTARI